MKDQGMRSLRILATLAMTLALIGCGTTQQVTLTKHEAKPGIRSVATVPDEGNSSQMDANLTSALQLNGLAVRPSQPKGTRRATDVDALVSYVDVWRWDLAMYLKRLTVKVTDAKTGDILALGDWEDGHLHGFHDAKVVMNGLITEIFQKLGTTPQASSSR